MGAVAPHPRRPPSENSFYMGRLSPQFICREALDGEAEPPVRLQGG